MLFLLRFFIFVYPDGTTLARYPVICFRSTVWWAGCTLWIVLMWTGISIMYFWFPTVYFWTGIKTRMLTWLRLEAYVFTYNRMCIALVLKKSPGWDSNPCLMGTISLALDHSATVDSYGLPNTKLRAHDWIKTEFLRCTGMRSPPKHRIFIDFCGCTAIPSLSLAIFVYYTDWNRVLHRILSGYNALSIPNFLQSFVAFIPSKYRKNAMLYTLRIRFLYGY